MAPLRAVRWTRQVLAALGAAHQHGIVHRDVKPSNVLLDTEGNALLADFGIALLAADDRMTRTYATMGSMAHMAPEQRLDARGVGVTADVYAAGATLFELLTGASPVDLFTAGPDSPRWLDVPEVLRPILAQATRLEPAQRHPSAEALAEALEAVEPALQGLGPAGSGAAGVSLDTGTLPAPPA